VVVREASTGVGVVDDGIVAVNDGMEDVTAVTGVITAGSSLFISATSSLGAISTTITLIDSSTVVSTFTSPSILPLMPSPLLKSS